MEKRFKALVCGAGGFIGNHLVKYLKNKGYWVRGVGPKLPQFSETQADDFKILDLRKEENCREALTLEGDKFDEVYQLAATMGGIGFIEDVECEVMHDSALINLNMAKIAIKEFKVPRFFFSSSVCVYRDMKKGERALTEEEVIPANPDNEYGWEKIYSERLYQVFGRRYGTEVRIGRFNSCYGPEGAWEGGKEKSMSAILRKVAEVKGDSGEIEIWGDGTARRIFVYVDDLVDATYRIMRSDIKTPVNIGPSEDISINDLVNTAIKISGKEIKVNHIKGNVGVEARNFSNEKIKSLGWVPKYSLEQGMRKTYEWIKAQIDKREI
jgi:nucleoside-diphosphate-sugar epimerase